MSKEPNTPVGNLRTWIVEDHGAIRELLLDFIGRAPGYTVVGSGSNADEAIEAARQGTIDLLILDLLLPRRNGLAVLETIATLPRKPRVLVFSAVTSLQSVEMCVRLGVVGYVEKNEPLEHLQAALQRIRHGGLFFSENASRILGQLVNRRPDATRIPSKRKLDLVRMISRGMTMKSISALLDVSEQYLYRQRQAIFQEWGVASDQELVVRALQMGMLDLDLLGTTGIPVSPSTGGAALAQRRSA